MSDLQTFPYALTYAAVFAASKAAFDAGTLGMQNSANSECLYRYPTKTADELAEEPIQSKGCAVGVALPDWVIERIVGTDYNAATVTGLVSDKIISVPDLGDWEKIFNLQNMHDAAMAAGTNSTITDHRKANFGRLMRGEPMLLLNGDPA
jgi:hypothetical protein